VRAESWQNVCCFHGATRRYGPTVDREGSFHVCLRGNLSSALLYLCSTRKQTVVANYELFFLFYLGHGFRTTRRTSGNKILSKPHCKIGAQVRIHRRLPVSWRWLGRWDDICLLWILSRPWVGCPHTGSMVPSILVPVMSAKESV
jgi:hypothetical protein